MTKNGSSSLVSFIAFRRQVPTPKQMSRTKEMTFSPAGSAGRHRKTYEGADERESGFTFVLVNGEKKKNDGEDVG